MLYVMIMAGGSGTRFWPLSRHLCPKQTMPLFDDGSLFEKALARAAGLAPPERTFVVTTSEQTKLLSKQAVDIPPGNIIAEPFGRDSAAAVFLGAAVIAAVDPDATILVKTADHVIAPIDAFQKSVGDAVKLAETGFLVTFGITPRHPATGYGYIERGVEIDGAPRAFRVARFTEKPEIEIAKKFLEDGLHFWNSGMFVWRASDILAAARTHAREHYDSIAPLGELFGKRGFKKALAEAYERIGRASIDYAIMEKAANVAVVEASFEWDDLGSPVSLRAYFDADSNGNVIRGLAAQFDSSDCVVLSTDDHLVAVEGCEGLVVIHTDDATLVCPADKIEDVKALVARLARDKRTNRYV
jgi:mannose-1-phosphate guanylyltransferase